MNLGLADEAIRKIRDRAITMYKTDYFKLFIYYVLARIPVFARPNDYMRGSIAYVRWVNNYLAIYFNEDIVTKIKDHDDMINYLSFLLSHEACHIIFRHLTFTSKKYPNHEIKNVAMDAQINSYLFTFPEFLKYKSMTVGEYVEEQNKQLSPEEILKKLSEISKKLREAASKATNNDPEPEEESAEEDEIPDIEDSADIGTYISGFVKKADHNIWQDLYKWIETNLKDPPKLSGMSSGGGEQSSGSGGSSATTIENGNPSGNDPNQEISIGDGDQIDNAVNKVLQDFEKAVGQSAAKMFGNNHQLGKVIKLKLPKPQKLKSEWERVISKFTGGVCNKTAYRQRTWIRPNRRFGGLCPGSRKESYQDVSVLVDVSGSMSNDILNAIKNISKICSFIGRVKYMVLWDTEFVKDYKCITTTKLRNLEIQSGGGTYLSEGMRMCAAKGRTNLLIFLTDLETPDEDYQTICELSRNHQVIIGLAGGSTVDRYKNNFDGYKNIKLIELENPDNKQDED